METFSSQIYQNLGKLFYAVAAVDGVVRDEEYDTLKNIVSWHWHAVDDVQDEFGTDAAFQIEIVFEWLQEQDLDAKTCFNDFKYFKSQHQSLFTKKMNRIIWRTVVTIADSFHGTNKAEKELLAKIKSIL